MERRHSRHRVARFGLSSILVLLSFTAVLAPASPAKACSCAPPDALSTLAEVPAAFVGTVVDIKKIDHPSDWIDVVFVFEVDEWIKGDLGETVEIASSAYGASCGFEIEPGQQTGVWVREIQTPLEGGLCDRIDPGALRSAAGGLPEVNAAGGSATILVLGSFGSVGVIALDSDANIVGYGPPAHPDGWWSKASVCPGGTTMVELVPDRDVFVRDIHTLQIVDAYSLEVDESSESFTYFNDAICRNESGTELILFGTTVADPGTDHEEGAVEELPPDVGVVFRRTAAGIEELAEIGGGEGGFLEVRGDTAVMTFGFEEPSVYAIDLNTGEVSRVHAYDRGSEPHNGPYLEGFSVSPSGRYAAVMDATFGEEEGIDYFLTVFDLQTDGSPVVARSQMLEAGSVAFIDDDTVAYILNYHTHEGESEEGIEGEKSGFVQLFDTRSLALVGEWSTWDGAPPTVIDGMFYAFDFGGAMTVTDPWTGDAQTLANLPAYDGALVQLPVPVELASSTAQVPEGFHGEPASFEDLSEHNGMFDDEVDGTALIRTWVMAAALIALASLAIWLLFFRKTPVDRAGTDA